MKLRPVHFVWLLLFAATLAMGAVAFWLLGREARRVEALARETLANRTAAAADNLDFLVSEIRSGIGDSLYALAESGNRRAALARLVASNPFVAAGFQMREKDGVTLWFGERGERPDPSRFLTAEVLNQEVDPAQEKKERETASEPPSSTMDDRQPAAPTDELEEVAVRGDLFGADVSSVAEPEVAEQEVAQLEEQESYRAKSALKQQIAVVRELNVSNRREIREADEAPAAPSTAPQSQDLGRSSVALFDIASSSSARNRDPFADADGLAEAEAPMMPEEGEEQARAQEPALEVSPKPSRREPVTGVESFSLFGSSVARKPLPVSGWLSLPVDGRSHELGWIRLDSEGLVFGAWLDNRSLEAELAKAVFLNEREGLRLQLIRPDGVSVGDEPVEGSGSSPGPLGNSVEMPVGPSLAGWRLRAFEPDANPFGRSFRLLGAVVVSGLGLAILLSGSLLLRQSRKDALEAQRKTTFVANVSHELKTPLTSIRMFAEMLQEGRVSDPVKRDGYLERISAETQRLGRLVNNVLSFSRLDRRKHEFNPVRRDLVEEVTLFEEMQSSRVREAGMEIELDLPNGPTWVEVDPDALGQILLNLFDNALKYASDGGKVRLEVERTADAVELRVRDFGPGIPSREKKRVFEAFHRVDDRLTAERAGCGLGLSIGKRLAMGMGIELRLVENRPSGCCFILRWPKNGGEVQ